MSYGDEGTLKKRGTGRTRKEGNLAVVALLLFCIGSSLAAQGGDASAGRGTIFVGTYGERILVLDERTMSIAGEMKLSIGIPIGISRSADSRTLYAVDAKFEQVEIFDIATRAAKGKFTLSTDSALVRMTGFNVEPRERYAVILVTKYTKKSDRYEISKPTLLKYDLARKVVTDTIPWPKGEERDFAQIIFSPNGDLMYFFAQDDVLIYDMATLKQVDRWELGRTLFEEGLGRMNFGFPNDIYEEPGFYTGLFRSTDAVNRRTMMGVARMDLANRKLDFYQLGPSAGVSFRLVPGKQKAIGILSQVGFYQFWTFDLANRRVASRTEFRGRPRMGLTMGSGGDVLYIHTAGHTIDIYDANSFQLRRTVELPDDMTTVMLIPPSLAQPRPSGSH